MIISEQLYNQIKEMTLIDYEGWLDKNKEEVLVTSENLLAMAQDLICEVEHWKEKYEDLKQDLEDNYKPLSISEQVE